MTMRNTHYFLIFLLFAGIAAAQNWPRFRGPNADGYVPDGSYPVEWGPDTNVVWATDMPARGASSPVVWNGRIYLTGYSGPDRWARNKEEMEALRLHVFCINGKDGSILWQKELNPERKKAVGATRWHGYATHTAVVDEDAVYVFFGNTGVIAYSHDGTQLWKTDVGDGINGWGTGSSLAEYKDTILVNAGMESGTLQALRKKDGSPVWTTHGMKRSWSTPMMTRFEDSDYLLINICDNVAAYDPATGKQIWTVPSAKDYCCSAPIVHDGIAYSSVQNTHRGSETQAIRLGGTGKIQKTHELWSIDPASYVSSLVYHDGYLYWATFGSRLNRKRQGFFCANAKTGEIVYQKQPDVWPKELYATPLPADGKIYYTALFEGTYVIAAKPEYELLAHNVLEKVSGRGKDTDSAFTASPVPLNSSQLLLRSDRKLYCIGAGDSQ